MTLQVFTSHNSRQYQYTECLKNACTKEPYGFDYSGSSDFIKLSGHTCRYWDRKLPDLILEAVIAIQETEISRRIEARVPPRCCQKQMSVHIHMLWKSLLHTFDVRWVTTTLQRATTQLQEKRLLLVLESDDRTMEKNGRKGVILTGEITKENNLFKCCIC